MAGQCVLRGSAEAELFSQEQPLHYPQDCRLPTILVGMEHNREGTIHFRHGKEPKSLSYAAVYGEALALSEALLARGIRPGDALAIHGDTCYEWLLIDFACILMGVVSVALYTAAPIDRVMGVTRECRCRVVFTDQPDYARQCVENGIDAILFRHVSGSDLASIEQIVRLAPAVRTRFPCARVRSEFTIVSTSGTLSEPKLFSVLSDPLLYTMERFKTLFDLSPRDSLLVFLPMAHLPQRMMLYGALLMGMDIILSSPTSFIADMKLYNPTITVTVPRVIEHIHARIVDSLRSNWTGLAITVVATVGTVVPAVRRALFRLVGGKVFGSKMRVIFVGSAPTRLSILRQLYSWGLPICEVYGTTELGIISINTIQTYRLGSQGRPTPWLAVHIDPTTREVMVKTDKPFLFARVVDGQSVIMSRQNSQFESTGDVGRFDNDGFIYLEGRTRDFVALQSGEKVFVRPLEDLIANTFGIGVCMVVGNGKRHLSVLLFLESSDPRLAGRDDLIANCRALMCKLNMQLHPWERIRAFSIVDHLPTVATGCLTDTLKVRRHKVEALYENNVRWEIVAA